MHMDMVSESTHPMVLKGIKTNRQPRLDLQTSKVKASMNTRRRLSTLTRAFLLKWLELEFSSLVSSFTGTISSFVLCSNDDLMVRILPSILIGLTLAVTSDFVTLFVVIVFHREFLKESFEPTLNMTCKQCRNVWRTGGRISASLLEFTP